MLSLRAEVNNVRHVCLVCLDTCSVDTPPSLMKAHEWLRTLKAALFYALFNGGFVQGPIISNKPSLSGPFNFFAKILQHTRVKRLPSLVFHSKSFYYLLWLIEH